MLSKWDKRFLELSAHVASWSKDPSTKCGTVITDNKRIISLGFNGFPQGVDDSNDRLNDRDLKYRMVLHAEVNALSFANRALDGCSIYVWPIPPCSRCAAQIIQRGIKRVISIVPPKDKLVRWSNDIEISKVMFDEAGVKIDLCDDIALITKLFDTYSNK